MNANWNLTHLYKTNNDFENDIKIVEKYLENIKKFKGKLSKIDVILDYFRLDVEMSIVLDRVAVYAFCKKDDNGKDSTNIMNYDVINNLYSKIGENLAFAKVELSKLDESLLFEMKNDKRFADFDRTIEDIIRYKKHILTEEKEQMMSRVSSFCVMRRSAAEISLRRSFISRSASFLSWKISSLASTKASFLRASASLRTFSA